MELEHKRIGVTVDDRPSDDHPEFSKEVPVASDRDYGKNVESQTRTRRLFGFAQIFAFSLTFMFSWEGMCVNMWFALYNGGPQTFAWSILIVYIGALAQSASIAEMASIQPIAGAQYHWTHHLAPARFKRLITWLQGWFTWFGWISLLAGVANATANMLQQMIVLNHPSYVPERWHLTLIVIAELVFSGLLNMYTFWLIPWIELVAGIGHVCFFFVFAAVLLTMGSRHSARFIFLETSNTSGWTDKFISWNVGLLTGAWSFTGFDGAVHMSEEVRKAKHAVPRALFWTIALNGIFAYAMVIILLATMGPLEDVLASVLPIVTILHNVTGSTGATTALVAALFIISFSVNIASVSSTSRLTWAWSRDGGLPAWFAYVSPTHLVPERAVWLCVVLVSLLCILNVGSTAAFGAIIALSSLTLYISYFLAISCMLFARFQNGGVKLGGWNMGRYGAAVNAFALLYTGWVTVFLPFPGTLPVTSLNMNYAGPIFLAVFLFTSALWLLWARKRWPGPNEDIIRFVVEQD